MAQVLGAVPTSGLDAVLVAVELVLDSGVVSAEHVINVLARLTASPIPESVQPKSGSYPVAGSAGGGSGGPMTGAIRSLM